MSSTNYRAIEDMSFADTRGKTLHIAVVLEHACLLLKDAVPSAEATGLLSNTDKTALATLIGQIPGLLSITGTLKGAAR